MLIEQINRGFKINEGSRYYKSLAASETLSPALWHPPQELLPIESIPLHKFASRAL